MDALNPRSSCPFFNEYDVCIKQRPDLSVIHIRHFVTTDPFAVRQHRC